MMYSKVVMPLLYKTRWKDIKWPRKSTAKRLNSRARPKITE